MDLILHKKKSSNSEGIMVAMTSISTLRKNKKTSQCHESEWPHCEMLRNYHMILVASAFACQSLISRNARGQHLMVDCGKLRLRQAERDSMVSEEKLPV